MMALDTIHSVPISYSISFSVVSLLIILVAWRKLVSAPLPPGPRGSILSGVKVERKHAWRQYADWATEYGPILYYNSNQLTVIVLNTAKVLHDLLDLRSKIYSDRPTTPLWEITGHDRFLTRISSRHAHFPAQRRIVHEELAGRRTHRHFHVIEDNVKALLFNLLLNPTDFRKHLRKCQGSIIMKTIYGYTTAPEDDHFVNLIERFSVVNDAVTKTGLYLVDSYPILKYLPQWMPGGGFQAFISERKAQLKEVVSTPFEWARSEFEAGRTHDSLVGNQLGRREPTTPDSQAGSEDDEIIKHVAAAMYTAGAETTVSAMSTFFLMMIMNPEIHKLAQEELEVVVGNRQMPQFDDRDKLPYIDAIIKEVLRFNPPAPLGLPHTVTQDDVYHGVHIPKGSIILPNIWAVTHDPSIYPDPMKFDPTRYLPSEKQNTPQPNPGKFIFGFGRRRCPAIDLTEAAMFLEVASILALFNITKALDAQKREITPVIDFTGGLVSSPEHFLCKIEPRFEGTLDWIRGNGLFASGAFV
ncbi:cytochrome P450 [Sistotremastrum suecicum HHB10207 ss-3]|uniref:Cytochrome P450 n=1 Tax=Sistotremastrum suecicum HHB10207 ss-3 TaxID=1314776 RepID=A0A166CAK6_9AGAM|nr:cytochrome P450 [Sistotremastrum suecicum HHB10207 ss-3]